MVAHCAERSHSWLYIRAISHDAPAGHGSKMDYFSLAGNFRLMVVEGSFAKETVEQACNGKRETANVKKPQASSCKLQAKSPGRKA